MSGERDAREQLVSFGERASENEVSRVEINPIEDDHIVKALKEDILDAVNDLKSKTEIWNLGKDLNAQCDSLVKKMVCGGLKESSGHVYDLVRNLFDILRQAMSSRNVVKETYDQQI